jgi:hypothetical protein
MGFHTIRLVPSVTGCNFYKMATEYRTGNDNGGNLSLVIIVEINKTFGIMMKTIPVYWPRANLQILLKDSIKSIMRRLIFDQPRQWHKYLDPI